MSIVNEAGEITQLSVTQVTNADHKQEGGCLRRWWFEVPNGLKPEQTYEKNEGTAGHELLRRYFLTGESPQGRTLMGKAVTGVILKGDLPKPGSDLVVERRFSGQEMRDQKRCECGHGLEQHDRKGCSHLTVVGLNTEVCSCTSFRPSWVPLDRSRALRIGGVVWDGAIDLLHFRDGRPSIQDHKFSGDPDLFAKKNSELIKTVQMPVYGFAVAPDAAEYELVHNYVSKKGVYSFQRRYVAKRAEVLERIADIEQVIARMKQAAKVKTQDDVPATVGARSCDAWTGCPHQSICSAFKRRNTTRTGAGMALTEAEQNIFDSIPVEGAAAEPSEPQSEAPVAEGEEEDADEAKLRADLAAAQKKLEEKQAKRKMKIVDVDAEVKATTPPPPPPASEPATEEQLPNCKCGEKLTPENSSRLRSGEYKHVGCKLDAPPPPPARTSTKKKDAPPPPKATEKKEEPKVEVLPANKEVDVGGVKLLLESDGGAKEVNERPAVAPKVFAGERQSDRDATAALDAAVKAAPAASGRVEAAQPNKTLREAAARFLCDQFAGENLALREPDEVCALIHAAVRVVTQ